MQPNANTEGNRASEVDPTIKHTVPWRVTAVQMRCTTPSVNGASGSLIE